MIIHTMVMRENDKLATDVYLTELATLTKNFSGAEIEGLVRCAQATAMNQLIKVRRSDFPLLKISEIFARILFLRIVLKDILVM